MSYSLEAARLIMKYKITLTDLTKSTHLNMSEAIV